MIAFIIILSFWININTISGNLNGYRRVELIDRTHGFLFFEIIYPTELKFLYKIIPAKDIGVPFNSSFSESGIGLIATEPATSCQLPKNGEKIKGKVALIERGDCSFELKTAMVEKVGAKAAIIYDYPLTKEEEITSPGWTDHYYIEMISDNRKKLKNNNINIPAAFMLGKNGRIIKDIMTSLNLPHVIINIPVNLTLTGFKNHQEPPWILI